MKPYKKTNYSFVEYIAACEVDPDDPNDKMEDHLEWANTFADLAPEDLKGHHVGDCTKVACTCILCCLEQMLSEYRTYRFPEQLDKE